MRVTIYHCERKNYGGEDEVLSRIHEKVSVVDVNRKAYSQNFLRNFFIFIFSPEYFFFVKKNNLSHHIFCNPFPYISILSIILLGLSGVKLRFYLHNFVGSCVVGTHFKSGKACFRSLKEKNCFQRSCSVSNAHFLLNVIRDVIFFKIFKVFKRNKFYFVGSFQAKLAKQTRIDKAKIIVVGNLV